MAARAGIQYLIDEVRRLSGAGTAEYSVGTVSYFTDDQIQRILDSRRVRLARHEIEYEPERSAGGGTVVYKHARIGYGWVEDTSAGGTTADCMLTDSTGSIIGTANYTLSAVDGFITFTDDQHGSVRYFTGWVHNPYKAAVDVLTAWLGELSRQPDFQTDNMRVWRSQMTARLQQQIDMLKEMGGLAPALHVTYVDRSDIQPSEWPTESPKATRIPT